jgi:hypothetical protein
MTPPKAPPTAVLERFYNVSQAAVRLGLREEDDASKKGEKWLRDGANRPKDGSKGPRFPHHRMAGQLLFSDSDLAAIAEISREAPQGRTRHPRRRRATTVPRQPVPVGT